MRVRHLFVTSASPLAVCVVCFGLVLLYSAPARAELTHRMDIGPATDVGPEAGLVFGNVSQRFLFRSSEEVLVTSGRAGVYKTLNGGQSWVRSESALVDASGVEPFASGFCQSPSAPEIAYLFTIQDGVSRTPDFGQSFEPLTLTSNPILWDCAVDPFDPSVVYAVAQFNPDQPGILFKSTDAGRSFSTVGDGLEEAQFDLIVAVAVAPTNPLTVYVANNSVAAGGLYKSSDGGLSFQSLPSAPPFPFGVYPHPTEDGTLFVPSLDAEAGQFAALFLSTDGGGSFTRVGEGLPHSGGNLAFDPSDPQVIYVTGGPAGLFRSMDGALTFQRLSGLGEAELLGSGVTAVGVSPGDAINPPVLYAGTSLGPFRSDDGGDTFAPIHHGYRGTQVNDLAIDAEGRLLVATINTAGLFLSACPGAYQIIGDTLPRNAATNLSAVAAAPDDPEFYVVLSSSQNDPGANGIFRTTDRGLSWTKASILGDPLFGGQRQRLAFAPSDSSRIYAVTPNPPGLYRSTDGAQSFEKLSSLSLGSIAVDPRDPDVIYVGTWAGGGGLFKSTNGGLTLQPLGAPGNFSSIALDPERPNVIYAGLRQFGRVIRSLDGGQTFAPAEVGLSGDRVLGLGVDPGQPMRLFVWMHAGGLFRSEDGADSWTAVETEETLRRSTAQAGQTELVISARGGQTRVYMGNASVLEFINP